MRLLLAPAGHGKTAYILQKIKETRSTDAPAPIWVILPNQEQIRVFRRRLAQAGGALGVEIDTFYGVYARVLAQAGKPIPRLFEPVQHRLLRGVVDSLCDENALRHYAPLRDKPGFFRRLRDLILELKQARVEPKDFARAMAGAPARLAELAAIYGGYQDWLRDTGWADAEGQGWLAEIALRQQPSLAGATRLLAVDGFDEFNPTQLAVLDLLARRAAETVVTLTGEVDGPARDAHRRFIRARNDLCAACRDIEIRPLPAIPADQDPALDRLESSIFNPQTPTPAPPSPPPQTQYPISLIEARNRAEETRAALRRLKALIVRQGLAPHETAVLARNLESYRPFLAEVAAEYGLPLYISGGEKLNTNPAITALLNLLSLPVLDWPQRPVLEAWRSPYFDWSALLRAGGGRFQTIEQAAGRLDGVVRASRIIGGREQWREALQRRAQIDVVDDAAGEDEHALQEGAIGDEAAALWRMFDAFTRQLQPPAQADLAAYIAFVEDLIGPDPAAETAGRAAAGATPGLAVVAAARTGEATAERDVAALQAFKDVLRGLLLAETITAATSPDSTAGPMPYRRFYSELRGAVEAATFRLPQPQKDMILAASVLQMRGVSFRAVALLGLSEGEFPQREREDPLLRDDERTALQASGINIQPRVLGDEITLFYEAITRARRHLLLTRPSLGDDGQPWEPSPYWLEVKRLADVPVQAASADTDPASAPEYVAAAGRLAGEISPELAGDWRQAQHAIAILEARQRKFAAGAYDGDAAAIAARLQRHYAPEHVWSSSRLESYAVCPFQFYVRSGLGLEPRTEAAEGYDVLILGSLYHAVLEEIYRQAREQGDWSQEALLALLPEIAHSAFDAAPRRYGFRPTPLWEYQRRELEAVLARTLVGLSEMAGDFAPLELEAAFGLQGRPPLQISDESGSLLLRGYIDRVDQAAGGRLRIIDYKSGSTPIRPQDLDEGKRIQLPLYALAARQALGMGEIAGGFYWHIGSSTASKLSLEAYDGGVEGALATAVNHAFNHVRRIRGGRYAPKPPAKGCPGSCPARGFCWRYRP